jgi:uncharacterized protein
MRRAYEVLILIFSILGVALANDAKIERLFRDAYKVRAFDLARIQKKAASGDVKSELMLGALYSDRSELFEMEIADGKREGLKWYRRAAETGDTDAAILLGDHLLFKDNVEARFWLEKAASTGDRDAQYDIGLLYYNDQYFPHDYSIALRWLKVAAEGGHTQAEFWTGYMYDCGQGTAQNYPEAARWYRLAALAGDRTAQFNLALMYEDGRGVQESVLRAVHWLKRAAQQRDADAAYELGVIYTENQEVASPALATQWFRIAGSWYLKDAKLGDRDADAALGCLYERGRGVQKNLVTAYKWYRLASRSKDSDEDLARLKSKMSPAQIQKGEDLALQWRTRVR